MSCTSPLHPGSVDFVFCPGKVTIIKFRLNGLLKLKRYPKINALQDPEIKNASMADFMANNGNQLELAYLEFLMSMYGWPEPVEIRTEIEQYQLNHEAVSKLQAYADLTYATPNNEQQQEIFDTVAQHIQQETRAFIFVDGKGGTGWYTLINININSLPLFIRKTTIAKKLRPTTPAVKEK